MPVITVTGDLPTSARFAHVGIDDYRAGRTAGLFMSRMAPAAGSVIVLRHSEGYRGHDQRVKGLLDFLSSQRPEVGVTDILDGHDQPGLSGQIVLRALHRRDDDVVGIYSAGAGRRGIGTALARTGLAGKVIFIGHELTEQTSRMLREGTMTLVIDQNPEQQAQQAIGLMLKYFGYIDEFTVTPVSFSLFCAENIEAQ
jgi:LacI family transcriptional regulator